MCIPGRSHRFCEKQYRKHKCQKHKAEKKTDEKSDEAIVVKKYVKAYGAKGRNLFTFPTGKHIVELEAAGRYGNRTEGSKRTVRKI